MGVINKVNELRKRKGLSQMRLAVLSKVGRSTISNIENGIYVPGVDIALRLSIALGCKVEDLFFLSE